MPASTRLQCGMLLRRLAAFAGVLLAFGAVATLAPQEQRPQPTFRTRTTLRAIEVRVVDQRGRPITGLQQQDFAIQENGKPQAIKLFTPFELTASAPAAPGGRLLAASGTRPNDLSSIHTPRVPHPPRSWQPSGPVQGDRRHDPSGS